MKDLLGEVGPEPTSFASRDTSAGKSFEGMLKLALIQGGYRVREQVDVGTRCGATKHIVDFVVTSHDRKRTVLVSAKWQSKSGTGEDKMAWEIISLVDALDNEQYAHAYIVIGGDGWTDSKREMFIAGGLQKRVVGASNRVTVLAMNEFMDRSWRRSL